MTRALVPPAQAVDQMREADVVWKAALAGLAGYPSRLRTLSEAAEEQSRALTLADLANVTWKPRPGGRNLRFPWEVQSASGRPGPAKTWKQFDEAVAQLGLALEGDSMKRLAQAFEQIAAIAGELADALDADERAEGRAETG